MFCRFMFSYEVINKVHDFNTKTSYFQAKLYSV